MRIVIALLGIMPLLAGCDGAKTSFDDSFQKSFREKFVSSCTSSAASSGLGQEVIGKVCTCASDKIAERFSVRDLMSLKPEQVAPIVAECRATIVGTGS
jgi:hypothetical protein